MLQINLNLFISNECKNDAEVAAVVVAMMEKKKEKKYVLEITLANFKLPNENKLFEMKLKK